MKKFLLLIMTVLPLVAAAQNTEMPFGDGESLPYAVSYRAKLIPNINVMRVTLWTVRENLNGKPHYHIVGNGKTTNFIKGFWKVNDTYHSWLDTAILLPSRMTSDLQEDDYRLKATYTYDWGNMRVNTVRRNAKWDADRYASMTLQENSGDAIALFYRMRRADVDKLIPGKAYPLDLVLNDKTRSISYKFIGREEVKVRKVGTFKALKFTCTMATSDGTTYEEGMELTVWISDDPNRIPLLMDSPIKVGRVRVTLTDGWKVLHPLTSKVK